MSLHETFWHPGWLARHLRRSMVPSLMAAALAAACANNSQIRKTPAVSAVSLAPAADSPLASQAKPVELRPREQLPAEAREMLTDRMMRHGDDMSDLTLAVLMLEYDLTHLLASTMATEPKLGRPAAGESGTLNALLPSEFFVQQDALAESAKALASAAKKKDDVQLAARFGDVAKACFGCHAAYLNAEFDPPGAQPISR